MAIRAHAPSTPRTITVRVRTLAITTAALIALAAVYWALHWATSIQPLSAGGADTAPFGLIVPRQTGFQTGPPVYTWKRGGRYVVSLSITNTASIPVTVTGDDHTGPDWVGAYTGPTLGIPNIHYPGRYSAFHPVEIPAGATGSVSFVFHANPAACESPSGPAGMSSTDSVSVHFATLGLFHDSETIPLGTSAFWLTYPTKADCR